MLEKRLVRRSFCYASAPPGLGDRKVPRWELPCAPALASASPRSRRTLRGQPPCRRRLRERAEEGVEVCLRLADCRRGADAFEEKEALRRLDDRADEPMPGFL